MINQINSLPEIKALIDLKSEANNERYRADAEQRVNEKRAETLAEKEAQKYSANDEGLGKEEAVKYDFTKLADKLKEAVGDESLMYQFSLDDDSQKMILKIIDGSTHEVVKQLPPEITLKIARIVSNSMDSGQLANATI